MLKEHINIRNVTKTLTSSLGYMLLLHRLVSSCPFLILNDILLLNLILWKMKSYKKPTAPLLFLVSPFFSISASSILSKKRNNLWLVNPWRTLNNVHLSLVRIWKCKEKEEFISVCVLNLFIFFTLFRFVGSNKIGKEKHKIFYVYNNLFCLFIKKCWNIWRPLLLICSFEFTWELNKVTDIQFIINVDHLTEGWHLANKK